MAATDARAIPIKNSAYRITFPILDADGDLVTGATGLDSEVSIDGGTFADCTNEATEVATASGMYFLDLTAAEMNGDTIAVIVKTSSSGAKTTPLVLYTAARSINDLAYPTTSGRSMDVDASGGVEVGSFQAGALTAAAFAAGAIDNAAIATDAIGSAELAATAVTEIQTGLATAAALGVVDDFLDTEIATLLAGLTAIAAAIGTVDGKVDTVDSVVDTIAAAVALLPSAATVATAVGALAGAEPTSVPGPTATLQERLSYLVLQVRNRVTQTSGTTTVYQDDAISVFSTRAVSDNGVTLERGEETTA